MGNYCFSGHESFSCKSLWLKKGYDYLRQGGDFGAANAVVSLGVGKNMVASIKYWMRVCGVLDNDMWLGHYLFDNFIGKDKYLEDIATLWLLHFNLVFRGEATLYRYFFCRFQKERERFDKEQIINGVRHYMTEHGSLSQFNPNTVGKDVDVLLRNYVLPSKAQSNDDFSTLFIDLDLLRTSENRREYYFNQEGKRVVPDEVFLYGLLLLQEETGDNTIACDTIMNRVALAFAMNNVEMTDTLMRLAERYPNLISYSDESGIRQIQFIEDITSVVKERVLTDYYGTNV